MHDAQVAADVKAEANKPTRILIVGDSYTAGSGLGGVGPANWTALAISKMTADGLNVVVDVSACGGAGYTVTGTCGKNLQQTAELKDSNGYNLVVFFGSRNDQAPSAQVQAAATAAFASVRTTLPDAQFLVIGPPWTDGSPPAWIIRDRDGVRNAAASVGGTFIDPVADDWFGGSNATLIGADGIHPTDQGHQHMADLITPALEQAVKALPARR